MHFVCSLTVMHVGSGSDENTSHVTRTLKLPNKFKHHMYFLFNSLYFHALAVKLSHTVVVGNRKTRQTQRREEEVLLGLKLHHTIYSQLFVI